MIEKIWENIRLYAMHRLHILSKWATSKNYASTFYRNMSSHHFLSSHLYTDTVAGVTSCSSSQSLLRWILSFIHALHGFWSVCSLTYMPVCHKTGEYKYLPLVIVSNADSQYHPSPHPMYDAYAGICIYIRRTVPNVKRWLWGVRFVIGG